jgi:hypothetical protein
VSGQLIAAGGPWAFALSLVGIVVTALIRGWLIPRGTVQYERQLLAKRAEDWKEAHALTEKAREIQAKQLDEILEAVKAIPRVAS